MAAFENPIKCVICGDESSGKTALLITYTTGQFPDDYVPTVFDNYCTTMFVDNKQVTLGLWDTAGQEDYDRLRPLSYAGADVFIICFNLSSKIAFENVKSKWVPEIREHAPGVPIILAGVSPDEREGDGEGGHDGASEAETEPLKRASNVVTEAEGEALKEEIKAANYIECSAVTRTNLKYLFEEAVRAARQWPSVPLVQDVDLEEAVLGSPVVDPALGQGCCTVQ